MDSGAKIDSEVFVGNLFKDGYVKAAETELCDRIKRDSRDLRAAFKLGVITATRGDFFNASRHFTNVLAAGWKSALARNNLAVTYFLSGRTRVAIDILLETERSESPASAASFNLAVICDRIASFGGDIPPELIECGLLSAHGSPSELADKYYRKSLDGRWESGIDGALYLWPDDIPPSLGFPIDLGQAGLEDAHRHLWQGFSCVDRKEWSDALHHFDLAASSRLYIDAAAKNSRTAALFGLCREIRADIAAKTASNDFAEVDRRISELASLSARLPVEDLLTGLVHEELRAIETQASGSGALADFAVLQVYSKAIKSTVDQLADRRAGGGDRSGEHAENIGSTFGARYAFAIEGLLNKLLLAGRYDDSVELFDWARLQWFGSSLKEGWPQEINHARALDFWSRAKDALARNETGEAERHLGTALVAAQSIEEKGLCKIIESELAGLHQTKPSAKTLQAIRSAIAARHYVEAVRQCSEALKINPHDGEIVSQEAIALNHLRADGFALERAGHWIESAAAIDEYLRYRPGDREAQSFRENLAHGHKDAMIEQAWAKWGARTAATLAELRKELDRICSDVLGLYPHHARALELVREMAVSERSAAAATADTNADRRYQACLLRFEEAEAANDAVVAFASAWELRALRPFERHTREACARAVALYAVAMRARFEAARDTSEFDDIGNEIGRILKMEPGFPAAVELLDMVQRRQVDGSPERTTVAHDKITEADRKLTELQPLPAFDALETVFVLDLPEFRTRAHALRDMAIALAKRQAIAMLLDKRKDHGAPCKKIAAALGRWAPEAWQDVVAAVARRSDQQHRDASLKTEVTQVADQARTGDQPPLQALLGMDQNLLRLIRRYGELSSAELVNLQTVRNDILQSMPLWSRCAYRAIALLTGSTSFNRKAINA
jgi:Flp pilus assembly protein TadD